MTADPPPPIAHRRLWSGLTTECPDAQVGILGIPFDSATTYRKGAAFGPARIRELSPRHAACAQEGDRLEVRVKDYGDVATDLNWERFFETVQTQAAGVLQHPLALFLGGDHSVSIPLMKAFRQVVEGPIGVIDVDAHPDLYDIYEGHHWGHACVARRALELPGLEPAHLSLVGLRTMSRNERDLLLSNPAIPAFTARRCYQEGIENVARQVVERLAGVQAVYLTLDIDGLDPAYAPGTGYPEPGGLSTRELMEFVRIVVAELPVRAVDVVEVSPPLDTNDITSLAALKIIYEIWFTWQNRSS
jgi:agmatinase